MKKMYTIRLATNNDAVAVSTVSRESGLADGVETESALTPMDNDHTWIVLEDHVGKIVGAAYFGPESHSDRVWNLYFLAVTKERQGEGMGSALVAWVEANLRERGDDIAKILLIETSSLENFTMTREFYRKQGYVEEARVREYYGPGDDKVMFWKLLNA